MFITPLHKKNFQSIILLNELLNGSQPFKTNAAGPDALLSPIFVALQAQGYVVQSGDGYYKISMKGQDAYNTFMKRYTEYLKVYDIFSYVDLESGEFAFARYFEFDSDDAWANYTNNQRFDDLRIAVAIFKKVDPAEIVFMAFINENRFDTTSANWQQNLMADNFWQEIEAICSTAIKPEEVGEDAMVDMISQGAELMIKLLEDEKKQEQANDTKEGYIVEETVEYYEPYYDPYYVSPIWFVPWFLW